MIRCYRPDVSPTSSAGRLLDGSVPVEEHLDALLDRLGGHGISAEHTLVALSTCRDELVAELARAVDVRWGHPFTVGGLGGIPAIGHTGWRTALSHVPAHGGRGAALVIGTSHIGVAPDGSIGATLRVGQDQVSATCGALVAVNDAMHADGECPFDDHEMQVLWSEIQSCTGGGHSDIDELTVTLAGRIDHEVSTAIRATRVWEDCDVAVVSGVHIHHPDGDRILQLTSTITGADGRPTPL